MPPLTVARALRTPEGRRGVPIRFRYAAPTGANDPTLVIRYSPGLDCLDYLDDAGDWLPYRLTPDDLDRPAEILVDGVDVALDR